MKKSELRKEYQNKRIQLTDSEIEQFSSVIANLLFDKINFNDISSIHIFLPIRNKKEIDTWHIIHRTRIGFPHVDIVIPKIISETSFENSLLAPDTELVENNLGIPEPVNASPYPLERIDVVFVPLLAVDKHGHRVGYGKGFYDRFLTQCRPDAIKIGLSFFETVEEIDEIHENDIPLNFCITPQTVYIF